MSEDERYHAYLICKQRGHSISMAYEKEIVFPKHRCDFCEVIYWQEERETNVPLPPAPLNESSQEKKT